MGSAWWGVLVLTAGGLVGCGGGAQSDLTKATDKARRLAERAAAHLRDPVYRIEGKPVPLTTYRKDLVDKASAILALDPEKPDDRSERERLLHDFPMQVDPCDVVNPLAGEALAQAAQELSAALGRAGEAPAGELALAHATLARLQELEGFRLSLLAARKRSVAWGKLEELENAAIRMADRGKRIANCDAILSAADESLPAMAEKAKADAAAAQTGIAELKGKIDALRKEKTGLTAANEKLLGEARDLRVESQNAEAVRKGIELFDAALAKENAAAANAARLTEIEDQIQTITSRAALLEADLANAQARKAAADQIASDRQQSQADVRKQREGFIQLLTQAQKDVEARAGEAVEVSKATSDLERQALAAYAKADEQFEKYLKVAGRPSDGSGRKTDPAIVALFGDSRMSRGFLRLRSILLQQRVDRVVSNVNRFWSGLPLQKDVPAIIGQVSGYLGQPGKVREQVLEDFRWAAKNYEEALNHVERKHQWAYQLQVAAAYAALNNVAPDAETRQNGLKALEALGAQEGSPNIAPRAGFLRSFLESPSGVATAPATAPAGAGAP